MLSDGRNFPSITYLDSNPPPSHHLLKPRPQRRFRYQHTYGVILACGALRGTTGITTLVCENHEDYITELTDAKFDAYQIKTRKPERGAWKLGDEDLQKALKRFIRLDGEFPGHFRRFVFVSNCSYHEPTDAAEDDPAGSPVLLLKMVQKAADFDSLDKKAADWITKLAESVERGTKSVLDVLKRVDLFSGPSIDDADAVVTTDHLAAMRELAGKSVPELNAIRDEMIHRIADASSMKLNDPDRHVVSVLTEDRQSPLLQAKRIPVQELLDMACRRTELPFRFAPVGTVLGRGDAPERPEVFVQKLERAGLHDRVPSLRRRKISAERHLLELEARTPERFAEVESHLEQLVQTECDDAEIHAEKSGVPYGREMFRILDTRLRQRLAGASSSVYDMDIHCLMGIAGLLTEECSVWWGPRFDLEENDVSNPAD